MKKIKSIIIAAIAATFLFSMIAFQPKAIEATSNVAPSATPSPRKIRTVPTTTREPIRKIRAKRPTNYKEGGVNDMTFRRKPRRNGKQSIIFDDTDGKEKIMRRKQIRKNQH